MANKADQAGQTEQQQKTVRLATRWPLDVFRVPGLDVTVTRGGVDVDPDTAGKIRDAARDTGHGHHITPRGADR